MKAPDHTELNDFSNWIKEADRLVNPRIKRSIHDITGIELFYWFKAGNVPSEAAEKALYNLTRLDRGNIIAEAKMALKRIVATGNENGLTAVDLSQYPGYEILSGPMKWEEEERNANS
jgi:hypothetical protein